MAEAQQQPSNSLCQNTRVSRSQEEHKQASVGGKDKGRNCMTIRVKNKVQNTLCYITYIMESEREKRKKEKNQKKKKKRRRDKKKKRKKVMEKKKRGGERKKKIVP